jgi:DNA-binding transcriptional regulator GbsR (MarR family)
MFRRVLDERKRREIDPTLAVLRECIAEVAKEKQGVTGQRLKDLVEFFETTTGWYEQIRAWPTGALTRFVRMGDKIRKLVGIGGQ